MLKHDPQPIESIRGLSAVLFAKRASIMLVGTLPFVVGGLMDAMHLSPSTAGLVTTIELVCSVVTGSITSLYLPRLPRYPITVLALIVVGGAHLLASPLQYFWLYALSRVISGSAEGVIAATTTASIATAKNPTRLTALLMLFGSVSGLAFSAVISWSYVEWGLSGVYVAFAIYCWLVLTVIHWFPSTPRDPETRTVAALKLKGAALAVPVLAGYFVWLVGESSIWAFIERFGKGIGLSAAQIGVVMTAQSVATLCGSGFATWLGVRIGRTLPLAGCIVLVGAVIALIPGVKTLTGYWVVTTGWTFLLAVSVPYIFGILASLDQQGRWLGLQAVALPLGTAFGPYLGGLAMQSIGYASLTHWAALSYGLIFLLMVPVSIKVSRASRTEPARAAMTG